MNLRDIVQFNRIAIKVGLAIPLNMNERLMNLSAKNTL